ncbi:MAG: hypothetical protein JST85_14740 [Acidobacteria bacterium]|nr:hypothetical protein [Acidobacteriota bacterium]
MKPGILLGVALLCLFSINVFAGKRIVIFDDVATEIASPPATLATGEELWVTLADLTKATKFVLKPQGVCRDELCFPIPKARKAAFLSAQGNVTWFNLSEFTRLTKQPAAYDAANSVWYFGPRPEAQNQFVSSLIAPDFRLPDKTGKLRSLSEFRGKKVLLLTWASW